MEGANKRVKNIIAVWLALVAAGLSVVQHRTAKVNTPNKFVGAWRLAWLERPAADGQVRRVDCTGLFVFTPDGHASVQVMERNPQRESGPGPQQYSAGGYEASWGTYTVNERDHTFAFHIEGALVRSLIGKDLPRAYEFSGNQLIVKSTRADEHWRVAWERTDMKSTNTPQSALTPDDIRAVSPALASYTQKSITEDLWKRPDLSARDRSLITVAALIARSQTIGMLHYFNLALDNGVTPAELSEVVTHLAFYSGWSNALSAVPVLKEIFEQRGIGVDQLPEISPQLLPLNEQAEAQRAAGVEQNFGAVSPGVVQYTRDLLFRDLWLRPALAPHDRSLITVSALIASGQVAQITYHLNRAMDSGLTQKQASEMLTHLAFYTGWPPVFSALPVVKEIFAKRSGTASEKGAQ